MLPKIANRLDQIRLFYILEQIMNNIDSDSDGAFGLPPDTPYAVPPATPAKPSVLRARLARILATSGVRTAEDDGTPSHFSFGVDRIDTALRGNAGVDGLPRAALHELHAASKDDRTSTAAMALLMALRCRESGSGGPPRPVDQRKRGKPDRRGRLYPPGLEELGINPDSIIHVNAPG